MRRCVRLLIFVTGDRVPKKALGPNFDFLQKWLDMRLRRTLRLDMLASVQNVGFKPNSLFDN